jgi:tight adherence protein B
MGANAMAILAALLAFVMVGGVGLVLAGGGGSQSKTVKRAQAITGGGPRVVGGRVKQAATANDPGARRKQILKTLKDQDRQARKASLTLESRLRQAGLSWTVKNFWIGSVAIGVVVLLVVLLLQSNILIALGAGFAAGFGLPRWVVGFLGKKRTKKFTESFSDAIDIIVRGIKSGLPVHDGLKIIARESPEPLAGEFNRLVENIGMGMTVEQALEKMYERMPTAELRFFTIVMAIQAKTGGNLAEALGNLSTVLRSRKLMRERIKAMSSEAIASASIIGVLPPGLVALISIMNPSFMSVMFTDPRGQLILLGGSTWMTLGVLVMRKMINFKF